MDKRLKMPDNIVQLRANFLGPEGDINNNILYMHSKACEGGAPGDRPYNDSRAGDNARVFAEAWRDHWQAFVTPRCVLQSVDWVWNEHVDTGPLHEGTYAGTPMPLAGTHTGGDSPAGVSLAVRLQTGLGGRGNHGRFFLPPPLPTTIATVNPDVVDSGVQTSLSAAATAWLAQINHNTCVAGVGDSYELAVVSFILAGALRAVADVHAVTAVNFKDFFLDYQRRRAPAHARHH